MLAVGRPIDDIIEPASRNFSRFENSEECPVILEAKALLHFPKGDQIFRWFHARSAWNSQADKSHVSVWLDARKREDGWNTRPLGGRPVRQIEHSAKKLVAKPVCVVKPTSRLLVVSEVGESARFGIERVGPIRIVHAGGQHHHAKVIERAAVPEPTAIADSKKRTERIIARVSSARPLICGVYNEIGRGQFGLGEYCHSATLSGDMELFKASVRRSDAPISYRHAADTFSY
jgi:hypothetical protein